jgi:valyl-tRNA synthetase
LWNAFRFAEPHLAEFKKPHTAPHEIGAINKWLFHTVSACFTKYQNYFEQHEFGLALATIDQFFWNDFCDNYLELIKNQLFNPEHYQAQEVEATRWTLYQAGLRILQMYAPYLPHVTETLYQELYRKHEPMASIHQTRYQDVQTLYVFETESDVMNNVIAIATQMRKLKSEKQLSLKTPIATMKILVSNNDLGDALAEHDQLIRGVTQALEITYAIHAGQNPELIESEGTWQAQVVLE